MSNELARRLSGTRSELLRGEIDGAGWYERKDLGREARRQLFHLALDTELRELRLLVEQFLTQKYWDQVESMARELERRMLAASSELVQELIMEEFFGWRDRARLILGSRPSWAY